MRTDHQHQEALSEGRPWWQHRWPWFLLLGPALAVVGCVITIVLALQSYGDQEIHDGGQRQGLVVAPPPAQVGR